MQIAQEVGLKRIARHIIFSFWQIVFDLLPFSPLRVTWLKLGGAKIGKHCFIDKIDFINLDRTGLFGLTIGSRCFVGRGTQLDLAGKISIADWVTISPRTIILSHLNVGFKNHPLSKKYPPTVGHTKILSGCFLGVKSIILGNIKIGTDTLVSAGSVVTKNLPSQIMAAGVPAKIKKQLTL